MMRCKEVTRYVDGPIFSTEIKTQNGLWQGPEIHANSWDDARQQAQELVVDVSGKKDTSVTICECD